MSLPKPIQRRIPNRLGFTPDLDVVQAVAALEGYFITPDGTGMYFIDHELSENASMETWTLAEAWLIAALGKGHPARPDA